MSHAIVRFRSGEIAKPNTLEEQFALLEKFGLPPTAAEHSMVKVGKRPDGRPCYTLVKRAQPIKIFENDLDGHMQSVAAASRSGAERSGFNRKRGRYNDEERLTDGQLYGSRRSIGDVEAWYA